jgi:hypothetical protein
LPEEEKGRELGQKSYKRGKINGQYMGLTMWEGPGDDIMVCDEEITLYRERLAGKLFNFRNGGGYDSRVQMYLRPLFPGAADRVRPAVEELAVNPLEDAGDQLESTASLEPELCQQAANTSLDLISQSVQVEIQIDDLNFVKINGSLTDMTSQNFMECSGASLLVLVQW